MYFNIKTIVLIFGLLIIVSSSAQSRAELEALELIKNSSVTMTESTRALPQRRKPEDEKKAKEKEKPKPKPKTQPKAAKKILKAHEQRILNRFMHIRGAIPIILRGNKRTLRLAVSAPNSRKAKSFYQGIVVLYQYLFSLYRMTPLVKGITQKKGKKLKTEQYLDLLIKVDQKLGDIFIYRWFRTAKLPRIMYNLATTPYPEKKLKKLGLSGKKLQQVEKKFLTSIRHVAALCANHNRQNLLDFHGQRSMKVLLLNALVRANNLAARLYKMSQTCDLVLKIKPEKSPRTPSYKAIRTLLLSFSKQMEADLNTPKWQASLNEKTWAFLLNHPLMPADKTTKPKKK